MLEIGEVLVYAPKQAFTAFALTGFRRKLPHNFFERPRPRRLRADLHHAENMMSQIGIWIGFAIQATLKLVHGGRYGAPQFNSASQVILESFGSAVVLTCVASLFDQLTYFCEAYFCNIPYCAFGSTAHAGEATVPIGVTSVLGICT